MARAARRGVTLVELLVVVAVLAILTSVLYPVFRATRDSADRQSCIQNMRVLSQVLQAYRQDNGKYPPPPGEVGTNGVPTGGVTGLQSSSRSVSRGVLWCPLDTYPERLTPGMQEIAARDGRDSTYQPWYNYYGYVTGTDGFPAPVTSEEAARYFFGKAWEVDPTLPADSPCRQWELKVLNREDVTRKYGPMGRFRGLWNYRAPTDTLAMVCPYHPKGKSTLRVVGITVAGEAVVVEPVRPPTGNSGAIARRPPRAGETPPAWKEYANPPVDWRINLAAYPTGRTTPAWYIGDEPAFENPKTMPLVQTTYRRFTATEALATTSPDGYGFYDTGVDVEAGDMVMVSASARWAWSANAKSPDPPAPFDANEYAALFDRAGTLWFTADGDHVEDASGSGRTLPDKPHALLIGYLGDVTQPVDRARVFALGSRGSRLVTTADLPAGATVATLKLSLNEEPLTAGPPDPRADDSGFCEAWISVFHPGEAE